MIATPATRVAVAPVETILAMGVTPDKRKPEHAPDAYSPHSKRARISGDWPHIQVSSLLARPVLLPATCVGMLITVPGKP